MKELEEIRKELDAVDQDLVRLFERRMQLSREVAAYKQARGLPVLDEKREAQVLASRAAMAEDADLAPAVQALFTTIMALSREQQRQSMREGPRHA